MAKRTTKTVRSFKEIGQYNPETHVITGTKDGEETDILKELALISKGGQEIAILIKQEDSTDEIEG